MIALCVDDETLLLEDLKRAVGKSPDISQIVAFDDAMEAEEWAQEHTCDIAFLDVRMPVVDGVELAEKLHKRTPFLPIIFCTGYKEYALAAFSVHASGYLLKPVRSEKVQQEISHVIQSRRSAGIDEKEAALLTVQPYGGFTVLDRNGKKLDFRRSKEKELFAVLVHKKGQEISTKELCEILWTDNEWMYEKNRHYLYTLFSQVRSTLREAGAESVLEKSVDGYALDMSQIYLDDSEKEKQKYMPRYVWSQERSGD